MSQFLGGDKSDSSFERFYSLLREAGYKYTTKKFYYNTQSDLNHTKLALAANFRNLITKALSASRFV